MNLILRTTLLTLLISFVSTSAWADKYSDTRKMFESAGVADMFNSAYGYAIFPTIGKGGLIVGAAYGKGRVYEKGAHIGDTEMSQASIGFQLGGVSFSQVVFFQDKRALSEFTNGNFEFGVEAQVTVLTAAAGASANTGGSSATASGGKNNASTGSGGYYKGMVTFTITKGGAMFEVSVGGQNFTFMRR